MSGPTRPLLRWHGGKWMLAPWIIEHLPPHQVYVELYGGAASVLLRKPRSYAEVYNDLDEEVVNLFRILRDPARSGQLVEAVRLTPFARGEFDDAYEISADPIEEARRLIVRSFMGFGSDGHNRNVATGFRATGYKQGTTPAHDWANYPEALKVIIERLTGVVIERREALEVLDQQDRPEALFYVDPPYVPQTRSTKSRKGGERYHSYRHELSQEDHARLLRTLKKVKGRVVLSGYPTEMYDRALRGWLRIERPALADGARKRTEVLWLNPAARAALGRPVQQRLSMGEAA